MGARVARLALPGMLLLAACGGEPEGAASAGAEGETRSYSPTGFEPAFRTRVPAGVTVDVMAVDSGEAVRFVGRWGDERDERSFLHLYVSPRATTGEGASEVVRAAAESYRIAGDRSELEPQPPPAWAVEKYLVESEGTLGEPITGWVALGSHAGRWFHILVQQPRAREDRFRPVVDTILGSWVWLDDGTRLEP